MGPRSFVSERSLGVVAVLGRRALVPGDDGLPRGGRGPAPAASATVGSHTIHVQEQDDILNRTLEGLG